MANVISIDSLNNAIEKELTLYSKNTTEKMKKISDEVMEELVENTKKDAPHRTGKGKGKYRRAITSKVKFENANQKINVWYVKAPHYRLSHLLERGHKITTHGKETEKSTRAFPHIEKNANNAKKKFDEKLEEAIKNGY